MRDFVSVYVVIICSVNLHRRVSGTDTTPSYIVRRMYQLRLHPLTSHHGRSRQTQFVIDFLPILGQTSASYIPLNDENSSR